MNKRVFNFAAGPAMLPEEVMAQVYRDLLSYNDSGMSIMEISPKSMAFREILESAEKLLRELVHIPANYKVLFLSGDATEQFSMVPMNLLSANKRADYIISGQRAKQAMMEAKKYGDIAVAASSAGATPIYSTIPEVTKSAFRPDADYIHICYNNSIYGTKFPAVPDTGNIPLVADMSSCLLSEPIDISKFALIYAGAEMNLAPAGLTVVIVRSDLIGNALDATPTMYNYEALAERSTEYTPPVFNIYVANLVLEWIKSIGGLEEMKRRNERKASCLYDYIDGQFYYVSTIDKKCRSMTNVVFNTGSSALDDRFCIEASVAGFTNLKGHESVGGICASIYNSMPYEGVEKLVEFMKEFAKNNSKFYE